MNTAYIGRFAPSPTGPLHFGSLVAAMGSYLQARAKDGRWLVRIEDIDPPREMPGAADNIIRTLEQLGFEWDGSVLQQSTRSEAYRHALRSLDTADLLYACQCSRKQLNGQRVYPGTCKQQQLPRTGNSLRIKTAGRIKFTDAIQGEQTESLEEACGDFVVHRRDNLFAYQLAVVVDDEEQNVTEIVRGADLLDNTSRQIFLQKQFGFPTPRYCHLPIAVTQSGEKLSKQTHAKAIDKLQSLDALVSAWHFLGQCRIDAEFDGVDEFWKWALRQWSLNAVPRCQSRLYNGGQEYSA